MESEMTTNRRQFSRVSFDAPAQLTALKSTHLAKVLDLSFKGALVSLTEPTRWPVGTPCQLTLRLAQLDATIGMMAEVAHCEDTLLGLQCRSIDLDSITHLRKLIELNLGDPASLERELQALATH
jgi:hypothetical protein